MPNWTWPNWPPFVMGGWQVMPTFPSRWYHPVLGSQMVANASAFAALDSSWSPTAGLADMRRTESEAELVINHDINLTLLAMTGGTPPGTPANVNRRSASWQAIISQGWPGPMPLAAAKAPIGGPAPVTEGRAPGVTPPPGATGAPFTAQARSEEKAPTAQPAGAQAQRQGGQQPEQPPSKEAMAAAMAVSAGVPYAPPEQGQGGQAQGQGASGQPKPPEPPGQPPPGQQPGHPDHPSPPPQPGHEPPGHEPPHKPGTGGGRSK